MGHCCERFGSTDGQIKCKLEYLLVQSHYTESRVRLFKGSPPLCPVVQTIF